MIQEILKHLGIEREECDLYLLLLKTGELPVRILSEKSGILRTTLYDKLKSMSEKGIVYKIKTENGSLYGAQKPDDLFQLFDRKIDALKRNQKHLENILPELNAEMNGRSHHRHHRFFEGIESVGYAMEDYLSCANTQSFHFWTPHAARLLSHDYFFYTNRKRIENNIRQNCIIASVPDFTVRQYPFAATGEKFKRELRLAPAHVHASMSYWIYGDNKVLFLASRDEMYAYIIESPDMAALMKSHWQVLWDISQPYKMKAGEADEFEEFLEEDHQD